MAWSYRCFVSLVVAWSLAGLTLDSARAGPPHHPRASRPHRQKVLAYRKLPLSLKSVKGHIAIKQVPTFIKWQGHKYDVDTGVDVLMGVIRAPEMSPNYRELALLDLARLKTNLKGRPCLDELRTHFDDAGGLEKKFILTCFKGSRDPRAIPLFASVLDNEQSIKLRLSAASGLAEWNVRIGVAELVVLLDSKEVLPPPPPPRMPYVRDYALEYFRKSNARKGWGFPYEETALSIGMRTDLNDDQTSAIYIDGIKKWFEENEHRFPDWKVGDLLPEGGI